MTSSDARHVSLASLPGTWRRRWIHWPDGREDSTTYVYWVQAHRYYGDVRIPGGRPSFAGTGSLEECTDEQVRWLCTQQGFAGVLDETNGVFHWRREIDFQPFSGKRDVGRLEFTDPARTQMLEVGVEDSYSEWWERAGEALPQETVPVVLQLVHPVSGRGLFVAVGGGFVLALDRRPPLPPGASLKELIETAASRADALTWLDVEISYGRRRPGSINGIIVASTVPWREGQLAFPDADGPGPEWVVVEEPATVDQSTSHATRIPTLSNRSDR
jgi:hypothetical protein